MPATTTWTSPSMLRAVAHAPSRKEADHQRQAFEAWCQRQDLQTGRPDPGAGLGPDGHLFPVPPGAPGAPPDGERGGVPVCGAAAADGRGQALQALRPAQRGDREDAPVAERRFRRLNAPAPAREGLRRRAVRGWGRGSPGGRRLMRKSTPLDETSPEAASKRRTPPDRHQPRGGEL